jgi:hypothetical protein
LRAIDDGNEKCERERGVIENGLKKYLREVS